MKCHVTTSVFIDITGGKSNEFILAVEYDFTPEVREVGAGYLADPRDYDCGAPAEATISDMQLLHADDRSEVSIPGWFAAMVRNDGEFHAFLVNEAEAVR